MPHKSKFKQQHKKEKRKNVESHPSQIQKNETGGQQTVSAIKVSPVKPKPAAPVQSIAVVGATRYPYMTSEIKWIGIFTGIIIVVLIVLAIVVPRFIS